MYLNKNKKVRSYQNGGDVPSEKVNWWDDKNYADFYDFASDKNVKGNIDIVQPRSLSKDVLDLNEEQLSWLLGKQWKYPTFEHGTSAGGDSNFEKNLSKKYDSTTHEITNKGLKPIKVEVEKAEEI